MLLLICPIRGFSWGDEGHAIVGLIAMHYVQPAVRARVESLLASDTSALTRTTGVADESSWADRYRDSDRDTTQARYRQTRDWHYVDIEIARPDIDAACNGHPRLPADTRASEGPAADCIVDKIEQFRDELHRPGTAPAERLLALQFLLHLVGDLHQPLHAGDDHDHGGNAIHVTMAGHAPGNLHGYWDTVFVEELGADPQAVAATLIAGMSAQQVRAGDAGSPVDWALESFELARTHAYGNLRLPPGRAGRGNRSAIVLDAAYDADARLVVAQQLERAGVRLARVLNDALR